MDAEKHIHLATKVSLLDMIYLRGVPYWETVIVMDFILNRITACDFSGMVVNIFKYFIFLRCYFKVTLAKEVCLSPLSLSFIATACGSPSYQTLLDITI